MLLWLAGARLLAGRCAVPFDGADAAWLVAFAHPADVGSEALEAKKPGGAVLSGCRPVDALHPVEAALGPG